MWLLGQFSTFYFFLQKDFTHIKSTKSTKHEQTPFAQIFFIRIKSTKRKQATFTQMFFYTHKKHKKYKT